MELGIHPFDDLVAVEVPDAGCMANNNVAPDMMTEEKTVNAERYSSEVFYDLPGFTNTRGRRVFDILSRAYSFSKANAFELALDEK
jgi:hypothetical protein